MKVGFYSPLPPSPTGVADYSAALLTVLQRSNTVEVNAEEADVFLYHLGNNQLHRHIYDRALKTPGVVVLHDAVLHHFFLGSADEHAYVAEFAYNYGGWSRDFARTLWRDRARSGTDPQYFRYAMLRRIAEVSRAVIVHNPAAAAMVKLHCPDARVYEIPHLFEPRPQIRQYEVEQVRNNLGLPTRAFLVGVFGHLRESKRLRPILRVFEQIKSQSNLALLVAGDFASADLARALDPDLRRERIFRLPHLAEQEWWRYAAAVDACISLRYPAAGETSGITIRLMGLGKPVIVTDCEENSRFPVATCVRVQAGVLEEDMLADVILWLSRYRDDAEAIGQMAQNYVECFHALDRVGVLYHDCLEEAV